MQNTLENHISYAVRLRKYVAKKGVETYSSANEAGQNLEDKGIFKISHGTCSKRSIIIKQNA